MTRDAFSDRLLDLAYGELSKREAREVEAHAASCDACRAELARIRGTRRIMAALPDEPAPERGERILAAAAQQAAEARRPRRLVPRWVLGGAVAAASIAVVAAVSLRVSEWAPRPGEKPSLLESPYATRPPADEPRVATATPAAPAPAEEQAVPFTVRERAEPRGAPAETGGVAPAPRRAKRPEAASKAAPPSVGERQAYAASPPPPAPTGPGAPAADEAGSAARIHVEREAAPPPLGAAAGAPRRAAAAPSQAPASPPDAAAAAAPRAEAAAKHRGVAAAEPRAGYLSADAADGLRTEVRSFPGCAGESQRRVEVDGRGRIARYVREGTIGGRRLRIEHAFSPDGRPAGVTVTDLDAPGAALDARALGLSLPARAEDAGIDAPPRCGR